MATDVKLLPCPFCGGPAERIDFGPGDAENEGGSCIACTRCQSSGPVEFGRKEHFVSNWNRRANMEPLLAENERLRERDLRWQQIANLARQADIERDREKARAERLAEALRELVVDMERAQANMRNAAKTDPRWEGCAEAIKPRVDAARAALDQEGGNG